MVICKINRPHQWKFLKSTAVCYVSTTSYQWKFSKSTAICYLSTATPYHWKFSKSTAVCYVSTTIIYQWKFSKSTTICYVSTTPHMWYIHPSSNVESPTSDSSQNPQFCSQPPPPHTHTHTICYRPSLSNIEPPSNEVESPIGLDNIQLDEGQQNSTRKKLVQHSQW